MTACLQSLRSVCCTLCGVHREEVQQAMAAGGMDEVEEALAQLQEQVGVASFTSTTKLHTQRYACFYTWACCHTNIPFALPNCSMSTSSRLKFQHTGRGNGT